MTVFHLTQADIDTATALLKGNADRSTPHVSRCCNCPVTQCLNRTTGKKWWTSPTMVRKLEPTHCFMRVDETHEGYLLPPHVTARIREYDWEGKMEPFTFELDIQP
jgi:hypothetical protein